MGILSTEQLIHGVKNGRPIAPFSIQDEIIEQYIKLIKLKRMTLKTDSQEAKLLAMHLREPLDFVRQEKRLALSQCEIYVLPLPLCMAYAEASGKNPIIVIASGFIDLVANAIFAAHLQSILPQELNSYYLFKYRKDMPASNLLTNAIFLLQLHFYRFCKPLPNIYALATPQMFEESKLAINGALLFTLLHELGHHKLKHLEFSNNIRPIHYPLALEENLSILQHQEMEADTFALNCLIEPAKIIGTYWQQNAVNFFLQIELVSGNYSDKNHPMAINRSFYSDTLRNNWGKEYEVAPRPKFFRNIANRYLATKESKSEEMNALIQTTREGCLNILNEINEALLQFGIDLKPIWTTPAPNWLTIKGS